MVGAGGGGLMVEAGGRTLLLIGAPPLARGTPLSLTIPAPGPAGGAELPGRLHLAAPGAGGKLEVAVRIRATNSPALLAPRPPATLGALLVPAGRPEQAAQVRIQITAQGALPEPLSPGGLLEVLGRGDPVRALWVPERQSLTLAGAELLLQSAAAPDLPAGAGVAVRLAAPAEDGPRLHGLLVAQGSEPDPAAAERWPPDERLAGRLRAALDHGGEVGPGPSASCLDRHTDPASGEVVARLLGEPTTQLHPLRIGREPDGGRSSGLEDGASLTVEVTFARLGRIRLEVGRGPQGAVRLVLRSEQALPAEAATAIRELAGAAFELGRRPAQLLVATGPIRSPPLRLAVTG